MKISLLFILFSTPMNAFAVDYEAMLGKLSMPGSSEYSEAFSSFLGSKGSDEAVKALKKGLGSANPEIKSSAIRLSGLLRDDRFFDDLHKIATGKDPLPIRQEAFIMAASYKRNPRRNAMVLNARNDEMPRMRVLALTAALEIPGKAAEAPQEAALNDSAHTVRIHAARNLAMLGNPKGRSIALATLKSSNLVEKAVALETLGLLAQESDREMFLALKANRKESGLIRNAAHFALKHAEIKNLPNDRQIKMIAEALNDRTSADAQWAIKEASIKSNLDHSAFISGLKLLSGGNDPAGQGARTYLRQHPELEP